MMNLEDFINKVPVLGAFYSLLTSEAIIASIAGVIATWVTGVEMEQPLIAGLIALLLLIFLRPRVERDANLAALKTYLESNQVQASGVIAGALSRVRIPITVRGKTYWIDPSEEDEKAIADFIIKQGINLIPTNETMLAQEMRTR